MDSTEVQHPNPAKTPIQILYEYGTKNGNLPVYVMKKVEGEAHQPSFVFSVKIEEVSCTGQGLSKKAAKHQAAEAALKVLKIDAGTVMDSTEVQHPNPAKTPIQILYEYGLKNGNLPVYVMKKAEGESHQPSFVFSVKIEEVSCTGQGLSKKAAQHQAAEAALKVLKIDTGTVNIPVKSESNGVAAETNNHTNSVGVLQELAVQRGWRLPEYTVLNEAGPPHKREFTVTCRMESLSEKAVGNSKNAAKKAAAEKLVAKLQSLSGCSEITWTSQPSVRFENFNIASEPLGQSAMSSSNTSVCRFDVPDARDEGQSLSLAMSGLSTTSNSSPSLEVGTNELTLVQPQTNMNYDKQTPQTTDAEVLESYPMTAEKRGLCLIINNYDFSKSTKFLKNREGTKVDEESLIKVFKWLGFEIELQKDCKREEILSLVQKLGQRDHSDKHCLVCCILSHGEEESVLGVDGLPVYLKDLKEPFNGLKCLSLVDKPKLFFIQACQGTDHQSPVYIEADGPMSGCISSDARRDSIPTDADFLLAMATVPHHVSYRGRISGTWFIQSLCQNLVQMVPRRFDLVSILTKVNADVSKKTDETGEKKQMPQPAFTLRKKVVFPLPPAPPPSL
ncbi:uncharacterized protein LOC117819833 isoform X2 [Notolabrus celidotus]|uniref:uncharacterized protein LOC117819833 isoform X2 n=1 Tax=Notolabrus celidotus TaxID=1203425 RepID=UPI00148F9149|nr:uncharacterized protein LOC117819833 isoform X2 [Notolabrus celidotus]